MLRHRLVSISLLITGLLLGSFLQPFRLLSTEAQGGCQTFNETGKTVCGRFLEYWQTHGGLAQQGYPITNEFQEVSDLNGQTYTVQYFERAVFEKHPENAAPNDVLLSQLGTFQLQRKYAGVDPSGGSAPPPQPPPPAGETFTFNGTTSMKTDKFHLSGGDYKTSWTASAGQFGCYFGATVRAVDPNVFVFESIANTTIGKNQTDSKTNNMYGIKAGDYYVDVLASSCQSWSITINK